MQRGAVAQMVERRFEAPGRGSSILPCPTNEPEEVDYHKFNFYIRRYLWRIALRDFPFRIFARFNRRSVV